MRNYDLTEEVEQDLKGISRYTFEQWGAAQFVAYRDLLARKFEAIGSAESLGWVFTENLPDVKVTRCEHHLIFYTRSNRPRPLIIAVFHERKHWVGHLAKRLREQEKGG